MIIDPINVLKGLLVVLLVLQLAWWAVRWIMR